MNCEDTIILLQQEMISLCLGYVNNNTEEVNTVFIYAICENNMRSANVFYSINNKIVTTNLVNDVIQKSLIDDSSERILSLLKQVRILWENLVEILKENEKTVPTQMKLVYDIKAKEMNIHFEYEPQFTHIKELTSRDIFIEWYEKVQAENDNKKTSYTKNRQF